MSDLYSPKCKDKLVSLSPTLHTDYFVTSTLFVSGHIKNMKLAWCSRESKRCCQLVAFP